ncbi:MAG: long-chain-fatty-acid--CoA ligase, partial [Burkholderiales bacterium]
MSPGLQNEHRPWLDHYPAGVPAQIDLDEFASINDVFDSALAKYRENTAFINMGKSLSYGELDRLSRDFAGYLLGELKLRKGDRVAIMMPNCLQYPVAIIGVLRAGLTVVNTNPMYTARELKHQLADSGASVLVVMDNFGHVAQDVLAQMPGVRAVTTGLGDMLGFPKGLIVNFVLKHVKKMVPDYAIPNAVRFRDALTLGRMHKLPDVRNAPDDLAFLQYTGGTTGVSKGAMLTHRNLVANMQQAAAWVGTNVKPGKEVIVTALPLYHIFALTANGLVFMKFGATNLLITNPRDMPGFVKELKATPFTAITGVNTLFNGLLNTPVMAVNGVAFSSFT